jgi:hypothetical protein
MRYDVGMILDWKYNSAEGIMTKDSQITQWPEALGTKPTSQQIDAWGVEYDAWKAARAQREARRIQELIDAMPDWATVRNEINAIRDAARDATTWNQARNALVALCNHYRKTMRPLFIIARNLDD